MLCVDPRDTPVAREADVHLAPRAGTNLALMNGLQRELLHRGWIDERVGRRARDRPRGSSSAPSTPYTPARVAEICGVEPAQLPRRRELIGTAEALVSTVLQGVYQSNQATAAACAVNNLHLLRGMLGRPGRRRVADERAADRAEHARDRRRRRPARASATGATPSTSASSPSCGTSTPTMIPHWAPPTHAMQIWRYAEQGSIELLWITATNPAVSLPDLGRIRRILAREELLVVVQDLFLTETAELADVVLPGATWGEKTGCFTNADRTVHLSERPSTRRARRAPTSTSSSTTRAGWTSATATARR